MIELTTPISEEQIRGLKVGEEVGITGVIFTGRDAVHKYLYEGGELPEGVVVGSVTAALADGSDLQDCLSWQVRNGADSFAALNTAFFADGALVRVPDGVTVEAPIRVYFLNTAEADGATAVADGATAVGVGGDARAGIS